MTTFGAGNALTAAQLNAIQPKLACKTGAQSVISSTTLVNDTELFLDFATTGMTYYVTVALQVLGAATADIKVAYTRTGTLTALSNRSVLGPQPATADATATLMKSQMGFSFATAVQYGLDGSTNSYINETFIVRVDVAGRLTLQWAQFAPIATNTTVGVGSYMLAVPTA